jgi:hypothetical protein
MICSCGVIFSPQGIEYLESTRYVYQLHSALSGPAASPDCTLSFWIALGRCVSRACAVPTFLESCYGAAMQGTEIKRPGTSVIVNVWTTALQVVGAVQRAVSVTCEVDLRGSGE